MSVNKRFDISILSVAHPAPPLGHTAVLGSTCWSTCLNNERPADRHPFRVHGASACWWHSDTTVAPCGPVLPMDRSRASGRAPTAPAKRETTGLDAGNGHMLIAAAASGFTPAVIADGHTTAR